MKKLYKKLTDWKHWPFYIFYFPVSYAWLWYYIKTRSLWFFTASNPTLAFGGFEGEAKSEMYKQLPSNLCPRSIYINADIPFEDVTKQLNLSTIQYPFIVKPDIGMKGILFRKIEHEHQLQKYHEHVPVRYIIQEFIDLPNEVSVFYCRMPNEQKGCITAVIRKDLPEVKGDGRLTIRELMLKKYKIKKWLKSIETQLGKTMDKVLAQSETFCLSHIANVYNGAQFVNLPHEIDDKLLEIFDNISHKNHFYYGRYDIKCASISHLKKGEFIILEFNGAGSVPNHISTDSYTTIFSAYKEILMHWKWMYRISVYNNKKGFRYWSLLKGHRFLKNSKKHFDALKKLDKELSLNTNTNNAKTSLEEPVIS